MSKLLRVILAVAWFLTIVPVVAYSQFIVCGDCPTCKPMEVCREETPRTGLSGTH